MSRKEEGPKLRAEATLLRIPIFALAVRGSANLDGIEFRHARRRGERTIEVAVRTERDPDLPYPGPLSRRVHMAFLSMATERGLPIENPMDWTWRDLCRRMGLPNSGRRVEEFKRAIRATWGLRIFGLERIDGRVRESWRRLYAECEFQNEARGDGSSSSSNRLWLAPWYLESLNAMHSAPVDYDLWKRFEAVGPLASRLYEYLIPSFFKRETLELAYDRLASAMPVVAEARRSHAIRQFAQALDALREEGVIASATWDAMKGTGRPKLILARGSRLTPRPPVEAADAADGPSTASSADAPTSGASTIDPELRSKVVDAFYRLLGKEVRPLRSDQAVAGSLIVRAGADRVLRLLPESVQRLKARFRNAETMGALVRYFDEVLDEDDRRLEADRHRARDAARREAEAARQSAEDRRRLEAWQALDQPAREAIRAAVLAEQPMLRRFPRLIEAACLQRVLDSFPSGRRS